MLSKIDNMIAERNIKSIPANIAGQLGMTEIDANIWTERLFRVLQAFYSEHINRQFVLIISRTELPTDKSEIFDKDKLWSLISRGVECFLIDMDFKFGLAELNSSEMIDVGEYCNQYGVLALHILGEDSQLYNIEGRAVAFYNYVHPEVRKRNRTGLNARSYRDYKLVIDDQGSKQLIDKIDEIWHDRNRRILISNRKTEKLLQTFLAKWLSENIHDARVASEVGKISGVDRTDIELTSIHTGDNIIIEVKWMGTNASQTSHDIETLENGIRQVCAYLDREPSALEGCVVCYDGCQSAQNFFLNEPIARLEYRIIWLESRSGSQIGAEG